MSDVTVSDTLAQSYVHGTSQIPGEAYTSLAQSYLFVAVAVETMGAINKDGMDFLRDLGRRITQSTDDHRECAFLFQRLSMLIQRSMQSLSWVPSPTQSPRTKCGRSSIVLVFNLVFSPLDLYYRGQ